MKIFKIKNNEIIFLILLILISATVPVILTIFNIYDIRITIYGIFRDISDMKFEFIALSVIGIFFVYGYILLIVPVSYIILKYCFALNVNRKYVIFSILFIYLVYIYGLQEMFGG